LAERQFTGTAFVVSKDGLLLTNRHVALPWEDDANLDALAEQGLEPMIVRFVGYLPGVEDPFDVSLLMASDEADLAVMVCSGVTEGIPSLELAEGVPRAGDEVIVLGYPTGLKAMLAQTGDAFVDSLKEDDEVDFWAVAQRLSAGSYIKPLASRGIVGQVAGSTIAYDAETTHGGSGGPVLDANGAVVAVNTAILPEYGGSNLGVPVSYVVSLLAAAGVSR
jgi:S1-C subfamily serine protease